MPRLRSMNTRNDARAAIRDEEFTEAIALMLVAFYDLALEYVNSDLRSHEPPRNKPGELEQDPQPSARRD